MEMFANRQDGRDAQGGRVRSTEATVAATAAAIDIVVVDIVVVVVAVVVVGKNDK